MPGILWAAVGLLGGVAPSDLPNVVLIVADDLGWADLGCYGADLHETPHLDRLAGQSLRFTQAYSAAPVCSPTRAALMTGKYPVRLGFTTWHESSNQPPLDKPLIPPSTVGNLPLEEVTLAERLAELGYATWHVGKWHLGDAAHYPEAQGFEVNLGGTFWGAPATHFFPFRHPWDRLGEVRYVPGLGQVRHGAFLADVLTDRAIELIDSRPDRPFFLYLCHYSVHSPIEAPPERVEYYRGRRKPEFHHQNPIYAAMVENLDQNVGRIVDTLDTHGLLEQTLIIFTSDNGGYLRNADHPIITSNAPLRSGKGSLYEGGVRVPLLIRPPGPPKPAVVHTPTITMDLFVTVLDAVGSKTADTDGIHLLTLADASDLAEERSLYFHFPHYYPTTTPAGAVRRGNWKLIEYFEDDSLELYDLLSDPGERHNLAAKQTEVAKSLRANLADWRRRWAAPMPTQGQP